MFLTAIPLDATSATPLHRQFYDGLRDAILAGRLLAGVRLPSTRVLASELSLSVRASRSPCGSTKGKTCCPKRTSGE